VDQQARALARSRASRRTTRRADRSLTHSEWTTSTFGCGADGSDTPGARAHAHRRGEKRAAEGGLGVREPRRPKPSGLPDGTALPEPEAPESG
jgi:hypothetical protein